MTYIETLDSEILNLNHLLESVPFSPTTPTKPKFFLNVYRLNYNQLDALNNPNEEEGGLANKFPINSNKLLKLGISLGNLIKSLQMDEEINQQQQLQQQQFVNNLNNLKTKNGGQVPGGIGSRSNSTSGSVITSPVTMNDPFNDNDTIISNSSSNTNSKAAPNLSNCQIKFIKNLLVLLKNFDIGNNPSNYGSKLQEMPTSGSNSTLNQYGSNTNGNNNSNTTNNNIHNKSNGNGPQSTSNSNENISGSGQSNMSTYSNQSGTGSNTNASPIKLNSKQLLIEKLEINISLDNLFIFKIIIKLLLNIYDILKEPLMKANLMNGNPNDTKISPKANHAHKSSIVSTNTNFSSLSQSEDFENSSIFSYNSFNSISSKDNNMTVEEYYRLLKQILNRINAGIIEPFIQLILAEIVENNISNDFNNLINNI